MENLFLLILKKFEKLRNSSLLVYKVGYEIKKSLGLKVDRIPLLQKNDENCHLYQHDERTKLRVTNQIQRQLKFRHDTRAIEK